MIHIMATLPTVAAMISTISTASHIPPPHPQDRPHPRERDPGHQHRPVHPERPNRTPRQRPRVVDDVQVTVHVRYIDTRRSRNPPGALIVAEKTTADDPAFQRALTDVHHDAKRAAGYSDAEIAAKERALDGVLVPVSAAANERMLREAGWGAVERFWQHGPFAAWIAVNG